MRQNYLYKCTDCQTVKAIEDDLGVSTWALLCRPCGQVVTEHYRLDVLDGIMCFKEKEDDDRKSDNEQNEIGKRDVQSS